MLFEEYTLWILHPLPSFFSFIWSLTIPVNYGLPVNSSYYPTNVGVMQVIILVYLSALSALLPKVGRKKNWRFMALLGINVRHKNFLILQLFVCLCAIDIFAPDFDKITLSCRQEVFVLAGKQRGCFFLKPLRYLSLLNYTCIMQLE